MNAFTKKPDVSEFVKKANTANAKTAGGKARAGQPGAAKVFSGKANPPKDTKCPSNAAQ